VKGTGFAAVAVVTLAGGCGGSGSATHPQYRATPLVERRTIVESGRIEALTPLGKGYELRFDLHIRLFGKTAVQTCIDNHDCPPGTTGFPDDAYDKDLKFVLTYQVPASAKVTVFNGTTPVSITPRALYALTKGMNPRHLQLGDPDISDLTFDIEVTPVQGPAVEYQFDSVTRLEQVFVP
jgi:hypothetical protein